MNDDETDESVRLNEMEILISHNSHNSLCLAPLRRRHVELSVSLLLRVVEEGGWPSGTPAEGPLLDPRDDY